jgi:hypothetical protein
VLIDVRPPHVKGLAAAGAEQEQELDRASDDEPRGCLALADDLGTARVLDPSPLSLELLDAPLTRDVQSQCLAQSRCVGGQPLEIFGSKRSPGSFWK